MRKNVLFCVLISVFLLSEAQILEDFTNGSLANWNGNVDSFRINPSFQLQLNANGAGESYLSTALSFTEMNEDREWSFWIRESFAPSNNNYARFYLMSNRSNLLDTGVHGYYLRFGEAGSTDAVRLYCQQGGVHTLLCSATAGAIAASFDIRVKVIRSADGEWTLFCSDKGASILKEEARCFDTTITMSDYLGLSCYYTASNRSSFYFDDIYCDAIYEDTFSPYITDFYVNEASKNEITISFNEDIDSMLLLITNFTVSNNIGHPSSVMFLQDTYSRIRIRYDTALAVNIPLSLHVSGISDVAGNVMRDTTFDFLLYQSQLFDIVISEIMAKPSPVVNLPDAEYLELRNRTNFPINLNGWQVQLGNNSRQLGNKVIDPNGYILVTSAVNAALFTDYDNVATVSSLQITDGGQTIRLVDNYGNLVHFIAFSNSWHENSIKRNGGWSLEMIDINNPCEEQNNWSSSQNHNGGTPCKENSISKFKPDIVNPKLDMVVHEGKNRISVYFSEAMLPDKLLNKSAYKFSHSLQIDSIFLMANNYNSVVLMLSDSLASGVVYTLTIVDALFDCVENSVPLQSFAFFGYAEKPISNDIVINEILFNPQADGVEFVEVYNRSNKIIDLRSLRLSNYKSNGDMDTGKVVAPSGKQLFPQQYMVLTTRPDIVQSQYYCPYPENFIKMNTLPSLSNTGGTVILLRDVDLETVDLFTYNEKMHYPLLRSVKGVSLERIHFDRKTQDEFNWHSSASSAGYATPGYKNSSFSDNIEQTSHFEVHPKTFSPDGDAYNDNLNISYSFPEPGCRASIHIYNVEGKKLRTLVNNQLLETEAHFTWDGIIDGNIKAPIGTYIVLIEYWNLNGKVEHIKKPCTLAIKLK